MSTATCQQTDLASNHYGLPLAKACRLVGIHPATGSRWILDGRKMSDGTRLRFPATRTPGGWRVRLVDLDAFLQAITEDRHRDARGAEPAAPIITPAARARQLARVDRELEAIGI